MSPTFEVTSVFRHGRQDWEDLGQHGDPPQAVIRQAIRWKDVDCISQFSASVSPDLEIPDREPCCVINTYRGDLVVLADYDRLWDEWNIWLNGERKRKTFGENYRLN